MSACPECGHVVAGGDARAEVEHMQRAHPDVIRARLVEAGLGGFSEERWPKLAAAAPAQGDVVQVLMTEEMARRFERRCLGRENTVGDTCLSAPLLFREDDVPTYTITARDG